MSYGKDIANALVGGMVAVGIACIAAGVAITLFCIYGIPYIWELVKPYVHQLTA